MTALHKHRLQLPIVSVSGNEYVTICMVQNMSTCNNFNNLLLNLERNNLNLKLSIHET